MSLGLRGYLSRLGGRTDPETPSSRQDTEHETPTVLYSCPACKRTYISEEMDSCSKCGMSVTRIPSEHELGLSAGRS